MTSPLETEALLILWLERRLGWGYQSIPYSVRTFRKVWAEEFGHEAAIPTELKEKVKRIYREGRDNARRAINE